jgi:hypothetical protein
MAFQGPRSSFGLSKDIFLHSIYPTALANSWIPPPPSPPTPQPPTPPHVAFDGTRLQVQSFDAGPNARLWAIDVSPLTDQSHVVYYSQLSFVIKPISQGLLLNCVYFVNDSMVSTGVLDISLSTTLNEALNVYSYITFDYDHETLRPDFDLELNTSGNTMSASCSPLDFQQMADITSISYTLSERSIIHSDPEYADVSFAGILY